MGQLAEAEGFTNEPNADVLSLANTFMAHPAPLSLATPDSTTAALVGEETTRKQLVSFLAWNVSKIVWKTTN